MPSSEGLVKYAGAFFWLCSTVRNLGVVEESSVIRMGRANDPIHYAQWQSSAWRQLLESPWKTKASLCHKLSLKYLKLLQER